MVSVGSAVVAGRPEMASGDGFIQLPPRVVSMLSIPSSSDERASGVLGGEAKCCLIER